MVLTGLDFVVLVSYMLAIAWMGVYFSRRNTDTEQYFVGGRSFPGWVVGLSLVGTSISSITFLAYPADAFKTAWLRFLPAFGLPVAIVITAIFIVPIYRNLRMTSAYEYLEYRFGPSVRIYGALAFIFAQAARLSIILYLFSLLVYEITDWDLTLCIVVCGIFVAFYTIVGGIEAVIWTDVVQTIVLVFGGICCLVAIVYQLPGGLNEILSVALADNKLAIADLQPDGTLQSVGWGLSLSNKTGTMMLICGVFVYLTEYTASQNTVQRYAASKSTREARKAMIVCACASVPIWAFYMFLGTALYVFFKHFPVLEATEMLSGERKAEQILPFFIIHYLPPGLTGLVIAAAGAAAMSSLDSSINSISAVGVIDLYKRHIARDKSDRHYLHVAWILATLAGVLMIGGAILLAKAETKTLQDIATIIASLMGAGLFGMYALGLFTRRGDARAVWIGVACTVVFTAWTVVTGSYPERLPKALSVPFDLYYTGLIGNVVMFAIGFLAGTLLPARSGRSLDQLTVWDFRNRPEAGSELSKTGESSMLTSDST